MTTKELLEVYFKLNDRFDFLWNFYTVFIVALGGYLLSEDTQVLDDSQKIILICGYLLFTFMNIYGLLVTSHSLRITAKEIYRTVTDTSELAIVTSTVRKNHAMDKWAAFLIHGTLLPLFIWVVLSK